MGKPMDKVSVIIPAFNVEHYIEKAIRSVADQTYTNWEIIVVDDGSEDSTVELVKSLEIPVTLIQNDRNYGPSYSRNIAIQKAQGEWLAVLDSDDWWEQERLEKMLSAAAEHSADVIGDDNYWIVDGADSPYTTYFHAQKIPYEKPAVITACELIQYDLGPLKPIIRKDFILENHLTYNESIVFGEDFLFLLECLLQGARLLIVPDPLYYRLTRDSSLTAAKVDSTERLIELTHLMIIMFTEGRYKDHPDRGPLTELLQTRLLQQKDALLYNRFITPFKRGEIWKGIKNSSALLLERPYLAKIIVSKVPRMLDYQVRKYYRPR